MAKFINTRKAVSELEDLIRNAKDRLVLISPYLKVSKDFRELLTYRNGRDKITTIVFGKQELKPDEMAFLKGLRFVSLKFNESMHAKCYLNDDTMIITSLNLYEFSMANNKEMGVLVKKDDPADKQLFEDALTEVNYILETSVRFDLPDPASAVAATPAAAPRSSAAERSPPAPRESRPARNTAPAGYCIRTGAEIPFNLERPLAPDAYKKWNEFGDPDYPEKFCHFSGEKSDGETTYARPVLKKNWKKAQSTHGF